VLGGTFGQDPLGSLNAGQALGLQTLRQFLTQAHVAPIYLFDVSCPKYAPWWQTDSTAYKTPETDSVVGCTVNGTALTAAANEAAVIATAGTWYWDGAYVYAHLSDGTDPNDPANVVQYTLKFYWSDRNYDLNGHYWEGRIKDLPSLNLRVEPTFQASAQTGGGSIVLINTDNWFNTRKDDRYYQWSAGQVVIYMGAEGLGYDQFVPIATQGLAGLAATGDKNVQLDMVETKDRLNVMYPLTFYGYGSYPNLRKEDVGRCIQTVYGTVYGAEAVCIDTTNRIFKMAGHAVVSIDAVRVNQAGGGNVWVQVNPTAFNLAAGQFTLAGADWTLGQKVVADVRGKAKSDGTLMENPADQVQDLLSQIGFSNINANSFADAWSYYDVGYTAGPAGGQPNPLYRVTRCRLGLYLDKQDTILKLVNRITTQIRAYFFSDALGRVQLVPFKLKRAKDLTLVTDPDVLSNWKEQQPTAADQKLSSYTVNYANHAAEGYISSSSYTRVKNQLIRARPAAVSDSFDSDFVASSDALELAQWMVNNSDLAPIAYTYTGKWQPFVWMPADQVALSQTEEGLQKVLEITGVTINLGTREVSIMAATRRGFDQCPGFWVGDSETTDKGNPLTWDGTERQYKTNNTGTWSTDQGFAMTSPTSADDKRVSTWS
jgi:hypothetical protein